MKKLAAALALWFCGLATGAALQYIYDNYESEDWLDCIELPECQIDEVINSTKVIRT